MKFTFQFSFELTRTPKPVKQDVMINNRIDAPKKVETIVDVLNRAAAAGPINREIVRRA